jgi:hypothetical protein
MAFAGHDTNHLPGYDEKDDYGSKDSAIEDATIRPQRTFQPPPLVQHMTPEQRADAEARLRRKIDFRLLPMVILMYIMNYLDRNNIAAARLAGLEADLGLTSPQYLVRHPTNFSINKGGGRL